jgi:hypothetical protein
MQKFPIPTSADQYEYLLRLYFGRKGDQLSRCINRAYRDFNRTMHGFAKITEGECIHTEATEVVRSFLKALVTHRSACSDQATFDTLHRATCDQLHATYKNAGAEFHAGQAQKWLNMALKYVFVFGEKPLPGYLRVFEFAHVPVDNIILQKFYERGLSHIETAWSRMSYQEYMPIQIWVRKTFPESPPLAVEFHHFQNSADSSADEDGVE